MQRLCTPSAPYVISRFRFPRRSVDQSASRLANRCCWSVVLQGDSVTVGKSGLLGASRSRRAHRQSGNQTQQGGFISGFKLFTLIILAQSRVIVVCTLIPFSGLTLCLDTTDALRPAVSARCKCVLMLYILDILVFSHFSKT